VKHTHPFNGPLSRTTQVGRYQKGKTIWILLKQETVSGSGISCTICKSAPRSRQITTPAPHHSVFYRPDALPATQPTASKHCMWNFLRNNSHRYTLIHYAAVLSKHDVTAFMDFFRFLVFADFFVVKFVLTHQLSNCFCGKPELCYVQKFQTFFFVLFMGVAGLLLAVLC